MKPGEPSSTARRVAAHRATFARVGTPYGDPAADLRLAADVATGVQVDSTTKMASYLRARTAFFDDVVVRGIERGVTQVVVAGAGYDARSLRYAKPGISWFELDHPDTQHDKVERLASLAIDASKVSFVGADFRNEGLAARLASAGCDPASLTLFVCEGVASYLDVEVLERLLSELRCAGSRGSTLAISVAVQISSRAEAARRARFEAAVAAMDETISNAVAGEDATILLASTGWRRVPAHSMDIVEDRHRRAGLVLAEAV